MGPASGERWQPIVAVHLDHWSLLLMSSDENHPYARLGKFCHEFLEAPECQCHVRDIDL